MAEKAEVNLPPHALPGAELAQRVACDLAAYSKDIPVRDSAIVVSAIIATWIVDMSSQKHGDISELFSLLIDETAARLAATEQILSAMITRQ